MELCRRLRRIPEEIQETAAVVVEAWKESSGPLSPSFCIVGATPHWPTNSVWKVNSRIFN